MKKSIWISLIVLGTASLSPGQPPGPLEIIRASNQRVRDILDKYPAVDPEAEAELYAVIDEVTDFEAISQAVTDRFCRNLSPEQCGDFNAVFIRLLRVSSIKKLGRYRADSFDYAGEELDGDRAVVRTTAHYGRDSVDLVYQMKKADGTWRITNYIVDDVDTILNYRKQFIRLFARQTFEEIMSRLEKRIDAFEKEIR